MFRLFTSRAVLMAGVLALAIWAAGLAWLSHSFKYELELLQKPVLIFVALQMLAGLVYLGVLYGLSFKTTTRNLLLVLFVAGLLMRLVQFAGTPVLEDDYYRYLWDGAVTANLHSPYAWSAQQIIDRQPEVDHGLVQLGVDSNEVLQRINHPWLRTIYPPVAQAVFALGYVIKPFELQGLRWVYLLLDLGIIYLLYGLVRHLPQHAFLLASYWLNPLAIKEIYNSGHMELILVFGMVLTIFAMFRKAHAAGGFMLSLAVGAKIWPTIWLPLLLRHGTGHDVEQAAGRWLQRAKLLAAFMLPAALLTWPVVSGHFDNNSGFTAYARYWQMNDSAYLLIHELAKLISPDHAWQIARVTVGALLLGAIAWCLHYQKPGRQGLVNSLVVVTLTLFLLSPTQFPWYYLWVLPLMTLLPLWSMLGLTVTLPLYYLRFYMDAHGQAWWYDYGVIWLEFVPIWLWLGWDVYCLVKRRATSAVLFSEKM